MLIAVVISKSIVAPDNIFWGKLLSIIELCTFDTWCAWSLDTNLAVNPGDVEQE